MAMKISIHEARMRIGTGATVLCALMAVAIGVIGAGCSSAVKIERAETISVGRAVRAYYDAARARRLTTTVWYPAKGVARGWEAPSVNMFHGNVNSREGLEPAAGTHPLILFSHGARGAADNYSWFAEALAMKGFMVMGVDHHHDSWHSSTPEGTVSVWERPRDLSVALDMVLADTVLGPLVDRARIGAAGHSSGGYAALALAGARYDILRMAEYCARNGKVPACRFGEDVKWWGLLKELDASRGSFRDDRVRAVFAMAPAMGDGIVPENLKEISVPVVIIAGEKDEFVPFADNAKRYAEAIPKAELVPLAAGEGHYVFLDQCTWMGAGLIEELCADATDVDRAAAHRTTASRAASFFSGALK